MMKCMLCGSVMQEIMTSLPFKTGENSIVIVKNLPVIQCENCQEYLIEDKVMEKLETILMHDGQTTELEVVRFAA